ncbi:hypothetical protein GCM10022403_035060 [Streptomyces coacervatus]|uniref:HTH cro/C1-type domain-containing protein n=1 Tax=Streptomyces coacervatus TaxID=647381 RepID=A0ABP7HKY6_9ACTN|nr:helix-turn-helix transcriptional regulator [Streptomyces coacervatus]MDF2272023.1 helix-turn-helix transcriptional regulator [Streptomyces coacervatus]
MPRPAPLSLVSDLGAVIRGRRQAKRMHQAELGRLVGYSTSWVCRVEANRLQPSWPALVKLADVLGLQAADLTPQPHPCEAGKSTIVSGNEASQDQEDAVRRRTLLAGATAVGAALTGLPAAAASGRPLDGLEDLLVYGPSSPTRRVTADAVRGTVTASRTEFLGCQYTRLATALPKRLALAHALGGEVGATALAQLWSLATRVCIKAGDDRLTAVTADRAVAAAATVDAPLVQAEARRMVASAYRRHGLHAKSAVIAVRAADALPSAHDPATLSARGNLYATAAYAAAKAGDRDSALALITEARGRADEVGTLATPAAAPGTVFGPPQVALHEVSVHYLLGDAGKAIGIARGISPLGLPKERLVRVRWETARAYAQWNRWHQCLSELEAIERIAPQEVRRPAVRTLTRTMLSTPAPTHGVKAFAQRINAI